MSENYSPSPEGTRLGDGAVFDLHAAGENLVPYEVLIAQREAHAAAQVEEQPKQPLAPERIGQIGTNLAVVRSDYLGMSRKDFGLTA